MESIRGLKQVIFGLTVVGFGMVLAVASFVWLMLDLAPYLAPNRDGPIGQVAGVVMLLAIIAGLGGLTMAYYGVMRHD